MLSSYSDALIYFYLQKIATSGDLDFHIDRNINDSAANCTNNLTHHCLNQTLGTMRAYSGFSSGS